VVINVHVTNPEVALPILVNNGAVTGGPEGLQPSQSARLLQNLEAVTAVRKTELQK
jgi:hypothetical protein